MFFISTVENMSLVNGYKNISLHFTEDHPYCLKPSRLNSIVYDLDKRLKCTSSERNNGNIMLSCVYSETSHSEHP